MNKIIMVTLGILILLPAPAVTAHGEGIKVADSAGTHNGMMQESSLDHKEMERLLKTFLINGKLSEADANLMLAHVNELLDMNMSESMDTEDMISEGMMRKEDVDDTQGHHGAQKILGRGMMHEEMMGMRLLYMLLGVTSLVWFVAGVMYLASQRGRNSIKNINNK